MAKRPLCDNERDEDFPKDTPAVRTVIDLGSAARFTHAHLFVTPPTTHTGVDRPAYGEKD